MIPKSHPRYKSLMTRSLAVDGVKKGITSADGLIAHGRGEAFDYLFWERTNGFAKIAIEACAAMMILARRPVISVNGNSAALCAEELVKLSKISGAALEVNIFHESGSREKKIKKHLILKGAKEVLLPSKNCQIKYLQSNRKFVNQNGIFIADVVFVPLEDGDRAEALIKNGKKVIAIDLNPLSRTSKKSTITIVDNIVRAIPLISKKIIELRKKDRKHLEKIVSAYDNKKHLKESLKYVRKNLP
jgi:4-phosphopantoate---beta-alanine ligase